MNNFTRLCLTMLACAGLGGCLLTSPYHGMVLTSRTQAIPFQAWSVESDGTMRIECMQSNRFGPESSPVGSWHQIGTLPISEDASRDLSSGKIYSASGSQRLPDSCWYHNRSNGWYYTSLRVIQTDYLNQPNFEYTTLDRDGVTCTAEAIGARGIWTAWSTSGCQRKYTNGMAVPWIVIRTER